MRTTTDWSSDATRSAMIEATSRNSALKCVCRCPATSRSIRKGKLQELEAWSMDSWRIPRKVSLGSAGLICGVKRLKGRNDTFCYNYHYTAMHWQGVVIVLFLACPSQGVQLSPFSSTIYPPSNMYRTTHTAFLSSTSNTFEIAYPSSPWNTTPVIIHSITSLTFSNGLNFTLTLPSTNQTTLVAQLISDSTVSKISLCFLIMDSTLYEGVTFSQFSYNMPQGATGLQTILVSGMENHTVGYAVAMQCQLGPIPASSSPSASSYVTASGGLISTNLTITFNTSMFMLKYLKILLVDVSVSNFTAKDGDISGQKWMIFGTSGIATDHSSTYSYQSLYPNNYLSGLTTIHSGFFLFSSELLSFNISTGLKTRVSYFSSQMLLIAYHCPAGFPITDVNRTICYSQCAVGEYADAQFMCDVCDRNCLTCENEAQNCTSCSGPFVLLYGWVCGCPEGSYQEVLRNGSLICLECRLVISGCGGCTSAVNCTKCMSNLELSGPLTCICPSATYLVSTTLSFFCVNADPQNGSYLSQTCLPNYALQGMSCQCSSLFNLTLFAGECGNSK